MECRAPQTRGSHMVPPKKCLAVSAYTVACRAGLAKSERHSQMGEALRLVWMLT